MALPVAPRWRKKPSKAKVPKKPAGAKRDPWQPPKKNGRPPHVPSEITRRVVEIAIGMGAAMDDVAREIDVSTPTLRKHYAHELKHGVASLRTKLFVRMGSKALRGDNTMMIWVDKSRFGAREMRATDIPPTLPDATVSISTVDPNDAARAYLRLIEGKG